MGRPSENKRTLEIEININLNDCHLESIVTMNHYNNPKSYKIILEEFSELQIQYLNILENIAECITWHMNVIQSWIVCTEYRCILENRYRLFFRVIWLNSWWKTQSSENLLVGLVLLVSVEVEESVFTTFVSLSNRQETEVFSVDVQTCLWIFTVHR